MILDLLPDYNLRGYAFEYISKVLLRRQKKNNFIFQTVFFDDIDELLKKYRFSSNSKKIDSLLIFLRKSGLKGDIIEFICDKKRHIQNMVFYDVKTSLFDAKKPYYEMCRSDFSFFKEISSKGYSSFIVSILLFSNWKFGFNLVPFKKRIIRVYSRYKN